MKRTLQRVADLVAGDLRAFGYLGCTADMVKDTWHAMKRGDKKMPHDIIGMFAQSKIQEALDVGLVITDDEK